MMKYITGFLGGVLGFLLAELISDNSLISGLFSGVFFLIGFMIPKFIKYTKMGPKELLSFHGLNSPISKSKSRNEVYTFLNQLRDGGLVISFFPRYPDDTQVEVDAHQWSNLTSEEKETFKQIVTQGIKLSLNGVNPNKLHEVNLDDSQIVICEENGNILESFALL